MAAVGTIAVRIAALTAEFDKGMLSAGAKVRSFGSSSQKVAKASAAAFATMGAALALVTRAASEQIKVEKQLTTAFRSTGQSLDFDSFKSFASGLQSVTTTGDEVIIGMGAMLASFGLAQSEIQSLIPSILDMSAATGFAADSISVALTKSISDGGVSALKRYGVSMGEAEQRAFKFGNQSSRTAMLVDALSGFTGQAAVQAETASGKFEQAKNSLGDLFERIGQSIDTPLAAFFDGVKNSIDGVGDGFSSLAGPVLLAGTALSGVATVLATIGLTIPKITAGLSILKTTLMASFSSVGVVVMAVAASIAAVAAAISDVRAQTKLIRTANKLFDGEEQTQKRFAAIDSQFNSERSGTTDLFSGTRVAKQQDAAAKALTKLSKAAKHLEFDFERIPENVMNIGDYIDQELNGPDTSGLAAPASSTGSGPAGLGLPGRMRNQNEFVQGPQYASAAQQLKDAGVGLVTRMGEAGSVIGEVAQGFSAGGPIGGIIAAIVAVISRTEGFAKISDELNYSFGKVVAALEPVMSVASDLFSGLFALMNSLHGVASALANIDPGVNILFAVVKKLADGITWVAKGIASVFNWVLEKMASFAGMLKLHSIERKIRDSKIDIKGLNAPDEEKERMPSALAGLSDAAEETANRFRDLNSELSNAPTGFKTDLRRQQAARGETSVMSGNTNSGGVTFNIQALDLEEAARKLQAIDAFKSFTSGSKTTRRVPFAVARAGG